MESGWTQLGGLGRLPASLSALPSCGVKAGTCSPCPIPLCTWTCGSCVSRWPGRSGTQKDGFNGQGSYLFGRDKVSERSLTPGKHLPQVRSSAVMMRTVTALSPWLYWEVSAAEQQVGGGPVLRIGTLGWGQLAARPSWGPFLEACAKILTCDRLARQVAGGPLG